MSLTRKLAIGALVAAGLSLGAGGCASSDQGADSAKTEQPNAEQPQAEHPQGEHPQGEHPKAEHPK